MTNHQNRRFLGPLVRLCPWLNRAVLILILIGIGVTVFQACQPVQIEWEPLEGPRTSFVWAIAVDPNDPQTIYAGTHGGGVYESTDDGRTWLARNEGLVSRQGEQTGIEHALDIRDILISGTLPSTIYVATWGPEGIYRWYAEEEVWQPMPLDVLTTGDKALINESVYVRALANSETGLFVGTDAGVFRFFPVPVGMLTDLGEGSLLKGEDALVRALVIDPRTLQDLAPTVYAASLGRGIYKSEDGGQTWQEMNQGLETESARLVNALSLDPEDPDLLYAGTFGDGVYRSQDGGGSWSAWNEGLPEGAEVWDLSFASDGVLFAGLRRNGTYKRAVQGQWEETNLPYGALALELDPRTGALYAGTWGHGLYRSEKGLDASPQDWQSLDLPRKDPLRLRAAVFAGPEPYTLYGGTDSDGVYASQDGGQSWERRSNGLRGGALTVWSLAVASDGQTLYAGTGDGVYVSNDGGQEWAALGADSGPDDFDVVSMALRRNEAGTDDVYAGTRSGLWHFDAGQGTWADDPQEFRYRDGVKADSYVPSVMVVDDIVYASFWGSGIHRSVPEGPWPPVEMAPKYVDSMTLGDKNLLQWGGKQFYALTERGLYGSANGEGWAPLDFGRMDALVADPRHPQVAYASIMIKTDLDKPPTSTSVLVSAADGRNWHDPNTEDAGDSDAEGTSGPIEGRVTTLLREPGGRPGIIALLDDGGLYRGQVDLPWPAREAIVVWFLVLAFFVLCMCLPCYLGKLALRYDLTLQEAVGLTRKPLLVIRIQSARFQNGLSPLEKLILATSSKTEFDLIEVWTGLDDIGVTTPRSRLLAAIESLADQRVLRQGDGTWRFATPGLLKVAAVEFQASRDDEVKKVRRDNRLFRDIERFFEAAGFDVLQDIPRHFTKFVLLSNRALYRAYGRLHAWLQSQGALQAGDVQQIYREVGKHDAAGETDGTLADRLSPAAFAIVEELPEVEAFRKMRAGQGQLRLIPLSVTTIRTALRERSAARDFDMLVQQERGRTDLFDIQVPVIDRLDFFGRGDVRARLLAGIQAGRSIDLWSLPAMGKTSLLWHLKETLVDPIAAFADLEYDWQGESRFQEQVIADLGDDLKHKYRRFLEVETGSFEDHLLALAEIVPSIGSSSTRLVLFLDGLSTANGDDEQVGCVERLRMLVASHSALAMVTTWRDPVQEGKKWESLGVFSQEESARLMQTVGAQMGLAFAGDSLDAIYRECGGHPHLLRWLGSIITRQAPLDEPPDLRHVTIDDVKRALPQLHAIRDRYFDDIWSWCSPGQRQSLTGWQQVVGEEQRRLVARDARLAAMVRPDDPWGRLFAAWIRTHEEDELL